MSRTLAIRALVRIEDGAYANVVLPSLLRESTLSARDRAQVTEWVYGTTRMQRALDYLLHECIDRPVAKLDPPVRAGLRLGAYQLMRGISPHAAVSETVAAMSKVSPRAKGFVNAVLRKLAASGPSVARCPRVMTSNPSGPFVRRCRMDRSPVGGRTLVLLTPPRPWRPSTSPAW